MTGLRDGRRTPIAAAGRLVARALERRRRVARGRQTLEEVLPRLPGVRPAGGWRVDGGHAASGSRVVFRVAGGDRPLIVKLAYHDVDRRSLRAGARALADLAADARLSGWRAVIPDLAAEGELPAATWVAELALPGVQPTWAGEASRRDLAARAAELIGGLHRATAERVEVDDGVVDAWVRTPVAAILDAPGAAGLPENTRERVTRVADELAPVVARSSRTASLVHGDFWPGNLLEDEGRLSGLVDWDALHRGPASVDLVHLLLHLRRGSGAGSIGDTAAEALTGRPWDAHEAAILAAAQPDLDARATLLLWWLDFAAGNLVRIPQSAGSARWLLRNVAVVVDAAEASR
jgi:Ser/Thr protein kinase RdoA (MazF antagonist)